MLSRQLILFVACTILAFSGLLGQNESPWDLQKCLDFGMENNLRLQQSALGVQSAQLGLEQSRNNRLPNLNAGFGVNNNFGFNIDPLTNAFQTNGTQALNGGISSGITLYNGLRLQNLIKQSEIDLQASQKDLDDGQNTLVLNIATAYLQILSDMETLEAAKVQLESTVQQRDRTAKLVRAGTLPQADLLQLESQIATDERSIVSAKNLLQISYLNLQRFLNLPPTQGFSIVKPEIPNPTELDLPQVTEIIALAEATQPSVEAADLRVKSAQIGRAVAQSGKLPTVSLNANTGTGYSTGFKNFTTGETQPLSTQLQRAFGGGVNLNINVPIYNRGQIENNIQQAGIRTENAELDAEIVRQSLQQNIQQAYVDAENAYASYEATRRQINALELTFQNTEKQYNLGLVNSVDYLLAKNNLNRAQFDQVRNKYIFFFRQKVLDFYMGKPITF